MQTVLFKGTDRYTEKKFSNEREFEELIFSNSKMLFGANTILIDVKKKIGTQFLGGVIPDFFLIDLTDSENPEFYLGEVELASHEFFRHIFPQITKFFAFFKNSVSQKELIEKIYNLINLDEKLKAEIKKHIGDNEIHKFLNDMIENSQNILLILDDDKEELPEIIETYTDTWGKIVKQLVLRRFISEDEAILALSPDFENIESAELIVDEEDEDEVTELKQKYTEEYHLDGVNSEIKAVFLTFKKILTSRIENIVFNPQRYYISIKKKRNFAYFKIKRKKIRIVVMAKEDIVRSKLKYHQVKPLSEGVQNFYNGDCCDIIIEENKNLDEVINLLIDIQK